MKNMIMICIIIILAAGCGGKQLSLSQHETDELVLRMPTLVWFERSYTTMELHHLLAEGRVEEAKQRLRKSLRNQLERGETCKRILEQGGLETTSKSARAETLKQFKWQLAIIRKYLGRM